MDIRNMLQGVYVMHYHRMVVTSFLASILSLVGTTLYCRISGQIMQSAMPNTVVST